jgi:hypothetical protein
MCVCLAERERERERERGERERPIFIMEKIVGIFHHKNKI